jgi:hypothetical protein
MVNRTVRLGTVGAISCVFTALLASMLGACTFTNVDLMKDRRVQILTPHDQATVGMPVTVRWTAHDTGSLRFAVFVDRSTLRPGASLRSLVPKDDAACRADSHCPDADWLASNGVYLADTTSVTLPSLKDNRPEHNHGARDTHTITIVLLDGDRRKGEGSWYRLIYVDRGSQ